MGEFETAMFQVLACNFELIFGILTIQNCDLFEVEIPMFQGLAYHLQHIFG